MSPTTRSNETTIKSLKAKQLLLIQRLERINEFVNDQENPIHSVQARLDAAHNAFKELDNLDASIQDHLEDQDLDAEINNVRVQFEELYFNIIAQIKSRTDDHNENKIKNIPAVVDIKNSTHKIQLPAITLPKFNGSYLDWLAFRDVYLSLIHNNLTLSNIEKMHYLRSSLTGEALKSVESLAVSSQNYDAAWNLLINRYENKRLIVQAHIRNILNLSPITKPTFQGLRNIIDIVKANVESLQILGIPIQHWDAILITIVSDKLDFQTNKDWHLTLDKDIPTFQQLFDFLEDRSQYFESFNNINNKQVGYTNTKYTGHTKSPSINHITTNKQNCIICNNLNHSIYQCPQFLKLNISNRIRTVNDLKLCMNCLRSNHNLKQCKSNSVCKHCNNKHNSLLHEEKSQTIINEVEPSTSSNHSSNTKDMLTEVLLSTAIVTVLDEQGKKHDCRILLDNGSQSNFITSKFCKKLNLRTQKVDHYVCGISANLSKVSEVVDVTINSQQNINYSTKINCLVLQKITNKLPSSSFPINNLKIPKNIQLADKNFNISKEIDMLVGAQLFFDIIKAEKLQLGDKHLYLYDTHLGWLIGGPVSFPSGHKNSSNCNISLKSIEIEKLNMQVAKFWEVEGNNCSIPQLTPEEVECEQYFVNTFQRNYDGRFIVHLPFKHNIFYNGNSQEMAKQCFLSLEKKLNKSTQLKQDYQNFIHEYLQLNHMEKVPANEIINSDSYYLSHHAIYKQEGSKNDILKYKVESITLPAKLTKRQILSRLCEIFDPLGILSPIIIIGKILIQSLWSMKLSWDQSVPTDIELTWRRLVADFQNLNKLRIPRKVIITNCKNAEIHAFADASEKAYGAVIYLKSIDDNEGVQIHLLTAKSRVAPLKLLTIPRLELLAAQLAAQLTSRIQNILTIPIKKTYFWTDSTIVLAWLAKEVTHWKPFVANRVADIIKLSNPTDCNHVNSETNAADIISRGMYPSQLLDADLSKSAKGYVALFVCLCTKALHIELVTDLTTESFLNALRRLISRRGNIKTIYSDNASTFVGATNELKEIKTVKTNPIISEILSVDNIKWSFIPPRSPHFGGLWEAGIKSVKFHLKRVIGNAILCYDELYTILTRIEACLNSRPLVPLSNDPKDFQVLTPGHFLIGDAITAPLEHDLHELQSNRLSRWQMLENMRQHFWKRRRREYLTQLQQRTKWKPQKDNLQPGTMVLLMEENTPPLCWPLGRIHQIHPGKDGLIRVVAIQTNKGYYKRAINKICILPITD